MEHEPEAFESRACLAFRLSCLLQSVVEQRVNNEREGRKNKLLGEAGGHSTRRSTCVSVQMLYIPVCACLEVSPSCYPAPDLSPLIIGLAPVWEAREYL